MLSLLSLEPALDITIEAGMDRIREKSILLGEYLMHLFHEWLEPCGFVLGSPVQSSQRGSHVSLRHPEAFRITRALIESEGELRVIPDFREPDFIRLGLAPLYNSFQEVYRAMSRIREVVDSRVYTSFEDVRGNVT